MELGGVREIPLSRGLVALVDDADFDWLSQWKWSATGSPFYAGRRPGPRGARVGILMHRLILDAPRGTFVDHVNGDPLDNRRANLRLCTRADNNRNVSRRRNGRWPYKGVRLTRVGRFQAIIKVGGKSKHMGCYGTIEEAARAYDRGALLHYGEFARLNFPAEAA